MKKQLILLFVFCFVCQGLSQTLIWDANSESDLAGYKIYNGYEIGNWSSVVDVGNVTRYDCGDLGKTKVYFVVTAYDLAGNESGYSNEVCWNGELLANVYYEDSKICALLNYNSASYTWYIKAQLNSQQFEIECIDSIACLILPDIDSPCLVNYEITIYDIDNILIFVREDSINIPACGDFNRNGSVDHYDLNTFVNCFMATPNDINYKLSADFNRNGIISTYDFWQIIQRYDGGLKKND